MLRAIAGYIVGQFKGTATNDSAIAGNVGELIEQTVLVGAAVSLTNATPANIASISLTAGDWDVWGSVVTNPAAGTTSSAVIGAISTTTAALPTLPNAGGSALHTVAVSAGANYALAGFQRRISVASTTTVFLVGQVSFAVDVMSMYGYIGARRRR